MITNEDTKNVEFAIDLLRILTRKAIRDGQGYGTVIAFEKTIISLYKVLEEVRK